METLLQVLIVAFMCFLCTLCLFAVVVIVRDIIHENAGIRRERLREECREKECADNRSAQCDICESEPVRVAEPEPVPPAEASAEAAADEPTASEDGGASESEPANDENAVSFNRVSMTVEEKYGTLSAELKRYFDDIVRYVLAKDGIKELKHSNCYDYKIGAYRVLRIMIKRDIICEFRFIDTNLSRYMNETDVKIKQSSTQVRVLEASAVGAVKDGIDLVCSQIATDKERKREIALARRREKRRLEKAKEQSESENRQSDSGVEQNA